MHSLFSPGRTSRALQLQNSQGRPKLAVHSASMSSWRQSGDSNSSWESQHQWQNRDWSKHHQWQESHWTANQSSSIQSSAPALLSTFAPCRTGVSCASPLCMSYRAVTENRIAGRDVADIRAVELSHRGLGDFLFRLLSEGRYQSIVWARSGSESVLLTALLKKIKESGV